MFLFQLALTRIRVNQVARNLIFASHHARSSAVCLMTHVKLSKGMLLGKKFLHGFDDTQDLLGHEM